MSTRKGRYGDGSISLRKDGRYICRYKGKSAYARTEAEAVNKLRELRRDVDSASQPPIRRKLDTYVKDWMETDRRKAWKPSTYATMETIYQIHIKEPLGDFQLGQIETKDIQRLLDETADKGLSYSTTKQVFVFLKDLFEYAFQVGDLQRNPVDRVRRPRKKDFAKPKQVEALEAAEVARLEEVAAKRNGQGNPLHRHGNLIIFMVHTGLRQGEMLGLKWEDVDFKNKVVHIVGNFVFYANPDKSEGAPKMVGSLLDPKSISGERTIPLNQKAIAALRQYEKDWGHISEFIAVSAKGKHLWHDMLTRTLQRMAEDAEITKKVHLHMLRHTFASRALSPEIGVDVGTVAKWLGHSKIATTYNTYTHVLRSTENHAADLLEAL
ncbi:site-specific integrase [Anaerotruncus massiliensis (ex Liu et al. 2021)]|uniref:Site-specific integrase n=2 Tax=Anaerotruncus TaxID=244127 RepID=A0A498CXI6_9FIRM|nr:MULTISPECIES: site-specific integrase [Anaerotruncus]MBC3939166.1 site-specific integrase [Anaerotruncus massiliensis (ex Togo et al. 2019)]RLL09742.1 site-specific integrase [Anaerotruncus massiliensis (ex Liu et al. 2021)]